MKQAGKSTKKSYYKDSKKSSSKRRKSNQKNIPPNQVRLNKFISNTGICSRREADKFIEAGVVTVNGIGITEMGYKVNPTDIVKFNNQTLKSEALRYMCY